MWILLTSKIVNLRNLKLGNGRPKIAVPITGKTQSEIIKQAGDIVKAKPDLVEWRIDFYEDVTKKTELTETGQKLRSVLSDMALLTTFRTKGEGGELELDDADYFSICSWVIDGGYTDALDLERFHEVPRIKELVQKAHQQNVVIIMSNHDFNKTPDEEEIVSRLSSMTELGADVAKMAVMPNSSTDVLTLLTATNQAKAALEQPIITMSMGNLGKVSRISGEVFGSCLTFGTVGAASAPGQISIKNLRQDMDDLKLD